MNCRTVQTLIAIREFAGTAPLGVRSAKESFDGICSAITIITYLAFT